MRKRNSVVLPFLMVCAAVAAGNVFAADGASSLLDRLPLGAPQPAQATQPAKAGGNAATTGSGADAERITAIEVRRPLPQNQIYLGNDILFKQDAGAPMDPVLTSGDRVSLNFENINVSSLASVLLGDLLQLNYTIDAGGEGVVSLSTRQPIPRSQVLDVLDAVLMPQDLAIVKDSAGVYHVTRRSLTVGSRPVVGASKVKELAGAGTVIVPLNHIAAAEMAKILGPVASREAIVYVDTLRNLLVLQGSKSQLGGWLDLVDAFDVDILAGMSLGIFPLEYANVNDVRETLQAMTGGEKGGELYSSGGTSATPKAPGTAVNAGSAAASGGGGGMSLGGLVRLFPVERLNALVVITPRSQVLTQIGTWIKRLDRPTDALEAGLYVYPVQNGSAAYLAEMLNNLFGNGAAPASGVAAGNAPTQFATSGARPLGAAGTGFSSGVGSGGGLSTSGSSGFGSSSGMGSAGFGAMASVSGQAGGGQATAVGQLEGNIRVVADSKRNALLIRAPRNEYRRIANALRELDKAPRQVLIDASIVEVTLTGNLQYGVEWYIENALSNGRTGQASLNFNATGGIGARQPGFSYTIVNKAGLVKATLSALADKSQLRVLSNPSVLVLDNYSASIMIGNQQPIKSSTTVTTGNLITEAITYKDTGVQLTVTPSVNSGGLITMDIQQQVTDVGQIDAATGQRSFLTRQIQSRVAVRSGEPVVLGGMIRENETKGRSGIPGLADIPLLGGLFSTTSDSSTRTELIVLLTPRAIDSDDELRTAGKEMVNKIRTLTLQSVLDSDSGTTRGGGPQKPAERNPVDQ